MSTRTLYNLESVSQYERHKSVFISLPDIREKIRYALQIVNNCHIEKELKDIDKAVALGKLGDAEVDKGELKIALGYYTESLRFIYHHREQTSNQLLSDIFTQRSAVLMKMNKYASAIRDINRALSFNTAEEKKCALELEKQACTDKLELLLKKSNQVKSDQAKQIDVPSLPQLFKGESNVTKSLSSAVTIKETIEKGRHIIALEDIPVGKDTLPQHTPQYSHSLCSRRGNLDFPDDVMREEGQGLTRESWGGVEKEEEVSFLDDVKQVT